MMCRVGLGGQCYWVRVWEQITANQTNQKHPEPTRCTSIKLCSQKFPKHSTLGCKSEQTEKLSVRKKLSKMIATSCAETRPYCRFIRHRSSTAHPQTVFP
eukprot:464037-Rhodomonas_salina.1